MLNRGVALLGLVALTPAHASLIEYSFTSTITGLGGNVHEDFGVEVGDSIPGGFVFDDGAVRTAYTEDLVVGYDGWATGVVSTSIYDMGNLQLWATVGSHRLTSTGDDLWITDAPTHVYHPDLWRLQSTGSGQAVNGGYLVQWIQFCLSEWFNGPLTSSELQVSDAAAWGYGELNRWFGVSFADGSSIDGRLDWIKPTSVPEPTTLSLVAAGALGAFALRRRRRAAV
jgi:hypothetical protein